MKKLATVLALGIALTATPALANEIDAKDPQKIVNLLREVGAENIEMKKTDDGNPYIKFRKDDMPNYLLFTGCDDGKNCSGLRFEASWGETKHTLTTINDWNSNYRTARAYLDSDNDPEIDMEIDLTHKVSKAYLTKLFENWNKAVFMFDLKTTMLNY